MSEGPKGQGERRLSPTQERMDVHTSAFRIKSSRSLAKVNCPPRRRAPKTMGTAKSQQKNKAKRKPDSRNIENGKVNIFEYATFGNVFRQITL